MNIKYFAFAAGLLTLTACGHSEDPAVLKGKNFIADSNGTQIVLSFAPQQMRVNGRVVNLYSSEYEAVGDQIKFGQITSTMMAGPQQAMQAESNYFKFMETVDKYNYKNNQLILKNADGKEMTFKQVEEIPAEEVVEESVDVVQVEPSAE